MNRAHFRQGMESVSSFYMNLVTENNTQWVHAGLDNRAWSNPITVADA